jgi:hypothetical protein
MASIINASVASSGIVSTADASGIIQVQSNGVNTNAQAWLVYDGVTPSILSSYNISSVTRNGTGSYTLNFTNAFVDTNYAVIGTTSQVSGGGTALGTVGKNLDSPVQTTTAFKIYTLTPGAAASNYPYIAISCFR